MIDIERLFGTRFIIVKMGCPYCRIAEKVVNYINMYLPPFNMIQVYDNIEWEEFRLKANPIIDFIDPKIFQGYPFIYIDGILVEPTTSEDALTVHILTLVSKDLRTSVSYKGHMIDKDTLAHPVPQDAES